MRPSGRKRGQRDESNAWPMGRLCGRVWGAYGYQDAQPVTGEALQGALAIRIPRELCARRESPSVVAEGVMTRNLRLDVIQPPRAVCANGPRPCQWEQCRHRLDPAQATDWVDPAPRCALDVADRVAMGEEPPTLRHIGEWLGVTRERIRQIERQAMRAFVEAARDYGLPWKQLRPATISAVENELLALIPERGMTLPEIVAKSGHSRTVIRYHLGQMARLGLVTRRPVLEAGQRQPRWLWFVMAP
jgi:hypothetical protein